MEKEGNRNRHSILYIQMLGGFSMTYEERPVLLGKSLSGKMLHLLLVLVYSRDEGIRRERLLEQLYGDGDVELAANSLRAMLYRLRKSLVASGLPAGEYISTKGGVYRWQAEHIKVELDVEIFQKQAMTALEEKDLEKKTKLLEDACRMYKGEFLPVMIGDNWVSAANRKYQELYFRVLRELTRLLKEQNRHRELLPYCEQALALYPYEEWQIVKLECLTAMKEYKMALEYYEKVVEETQQEYGILPSEEMQQYYRSIRNMIQFEMSNIEEIQTHLKPDYSTLGATRCDYLTFIDIYRYIVWVLERRRTRAYLTLFTLVDKDGVPLETSEVLDDARNNLDKAIGCSVRRSDLYTRYGKNQFLLLMTATNQEGCEVAIGRIKEAFQNMNHRRRVGIYYACRPAVEVQDDLLRKNMNQNGKELGKPIERRGGMKYSGVTKE